MYNLNFISIMHKNLKKNNISLNEINMNEIY